MPDCGVGALEPDESLTPCFADDVSCVVPWLLPALAQRKHCTQAG